MKHCLQGIRGLCYPNVDVIVVDNASDDDAAKRIADACSARCIREPVIGLSRSRNRGARYSEAEIVAFIDDDAVPKTDWLCNLIEEFSDPSVMAVTGVISAMTPSPAGIEQYSRAGQQRRSYGRGRFTARTRDPLGCIRQIRSSAGTRTRFRRV